MATARKDCHSSDTYQQYQGIAFSNSGNFNLFERSLWSAHINCCITLSRGQVSFDPTSHSSTRPIIGSSEKREAVFRAIAKVTGGPERWPLYLTGTQHAIVSSNLSSESIDTKNQDSLRPDRFIVDSLIKSIAEALKNPRIVMNVNWYNQSNAQVSAFNKDEEVTVAESFPFSQKDGRLLLMAVSRLPRKDQIECLAVFVEVLFTALTNMNSSKNFQNMASKNPEVSSFVGRVLTICATMVIMVDVGPSLSDALFAQVGPSVYQLPSLISQNEALEPSSTQDQSWYKRESCFMGVFADWESPIIPSVGSLISRNKLSGLSHSQFEAILEMAFVMGLGAAKYDRGCLLFSTWNASGRRPLWDHTSIMEIELRSIDFQHLASPKLLMELREDICMVHHFIYGNSGGFVDSMLSTVFNNREERINTSICLNDLLSTMLTKAETILNGLMDESQSDTLNEAHPSLHFSLLEAISVYVSFLVSMHTKSGDNFLKNSRQEEKRKSRPSLRIGEDVEIMASILHGDEESGQSEGDYDFKESNEEESTSAVAKLHITCDAFGAAPIHPDWLDVSCTYREGISNESAVDHAERALMCLNKLSHYAFVRYTKSLNDVLGTFAKNLINLEEVTDVAARICLQSQEETYSTKVWKNEEHAGEFESAVASIARLDKEGIRFFLSNIDCKNRRLVREAWCPNSAQRIRGCIQDPSVSVEGYELHHPEYRAGGEWELLLSETLLGACLNAIPRDTGEEELVFFNNNPEICVNAKIAYANAERWRKVFESSVSHLAPVTALLRFGISRGSGRIPHPFYEGNVMEGAAAITINEALPFERIVASEHGRIAAFETLRLLPIIVSANRGETRLKRACFAVASNLLVDTNAFTHLTALHDTSFIFSLLPILAERMQESNVNIENYTKAVRFLMEKFMTLLQYQAVDVLPSGVDNLSISTIFVYLRDDEALLKIDTVVWSSVPSRQLLSAKIIDVHAKHQELRHLVNFLCDQRLETNFELRSRLTSILCSVAEIDHGLFTSESQFEGKCGPLVDQLSRSLSSMEKRSVQSLIRTSILNRYEGEENDFQCSLLKQMCRLLSVLASASSFRISDEAGMQSTASCVLDELMHGIEQKIISVSESDDNAALTLAFLLGTCESKLQQIGSILFTLSQSKAGVWNEESGLNILPLEMLFEFVRDLSTSLPFRSSESTASKASNRFAAGWNFPVSVDRIQKNADNISGIIAHTKPAFAAPLACSFVLRSGFHAQHWYNCYTCGLVWDKGCCTLCALTCHRGHEVAYSRYSSFFCDCGADVSSAVDDNRVVCKCISPRSSDEATQVFASDVVKSFLEETKPNSTTTHKLSQPDNATFATRLISPVEIAAIAFPTVAIGALQRFKEEAEKSKWTSSFFRLLGNRNFTMDENDSNTVIQMGQVFGIDQEKDFNPRKSMISRLRSRRGKILSVEQICGKALVPVRAARSGAFNVKLSSDTATDRLKRAMLSKNSVNRAILVADIRGRLILAEPSSLLFCSVLPTVNTKYVHDAIESLSARSQMSILGSANVKFNIVGMKLCDENQRHLVLWGVSEACVIILSQNCDNLERSIDLKVDVEQSESAADFLIKCEWLPGFQSFVAVVCGTAVKVFDIRHTENDLVVPSVIYTLAQDTIVKDVAFVPYKTSLPRIEVHGKCVIKLFILLDTGRVHAVEVRFDANEEIEEEASRFLESGDCISLPIGGVRSYQGLDPACAGSTSRSLGEGSSLDFLPQSRLLLYKCVSSSVLALIVDDKANVIGSFEFLPNVLSSDNLGLASEVYFMTGPYTLWAEFGIVRNEAFRVLCVAKSSRTNQPRLLCIEFNEQYTRVKPFTWSVTSSLGLGLSLCSSFEGLAVFSAPCSSGDDRPLERAYVGIVTSSGALLIYGEDHEEYGDSFTATTEPNVTKRSASVTIFEKLVDVSEQKNLTFGGDAVGGDPNGAKMKLSVKNNIYLLSPSREGCTVTICLSDHSTKGGEKEAITMKRHESASTDVQPSTTISGQSQDEQDLVIVALRVLVGSTSQDCIPRQLLVEGRPHQLTADLKRWYDFPFTKTEILLGLRNGFVTLGVVSSFSGTNPMIDAIQVYAISRKKISSWIPTGYPAVILPIPEVESPSHYYNNHLSLVRSLSSLTHLYRILDSDWKQASEEGQILKRLVRAITVRGDQRLKDSMISLLQEVVPNENQRQLFLDEATLSGVTQYLTLAIDKGEGFDAGDCNSRAKLAYVIGGSLKASICIAERSPRNYAISTEKFIAESMSKVSIAMLAMDVMGRFLQYDMGDLLLVDDVVKLALLEIGICDCLVGVDKKVFASFSLIEALLQSSTDLVIQRCCNAIACFVESKENRHVGGAIDKHSEFTASQPIAYQCDSCSKFPITDSRFTLPEGDNYDIDLCTNCFRIADQYAVRHLDDASAPVLVNGKAIGEDAKLSCGQVHLMRPVLIVNGPLVEQAVMEVKTAVAHGKSRGKETIDEDSSLKKALSRQANVNETVNFSPILGNLFRDVLEHTSSVLSRDSQLECESGTTINPLFLLVLRFIKTSKNEETYLSRAKQFARVVTKHVSTVLGDISRIKTSHPRKLQLINCLRSLSQLLSCKLDTGTSLPMGTTNPSMLKNKDKTDPRFVCDEHGVPAVRRRCSRGFHMNRRFYVCGVDRKHRCKYFRWADDEDDEVDHPLAQSEFLKDMEVALWTLMDESYGQSQVPLSTLLCNLLESELMNQERRVDSTVPTEVKSNGTQKTGSKSTSLPSSFDRSCAIVEFNDGVYCSREKLFGIKGDFSCIKEARGEQERNLLDESGEKNVEIKVVEAILELVSAVAGTVVNDDSRDCSQIQARWFSLLCEIISLSPSEQFRSQAKRALKRLCGGRRALYHNVRDHYVFGFQFRMLLEHSSKSLQAAHDVQEQAKQCGQSWSTDSFTWKSLKAGALIGTLDLISEDALSVDNNKRIGEILDELINATKSRGGNWRQFCGLHSLPRSERIITSTLSADTFAMHIDENCISSASPILSLLWVACSLHGPSQVKTFKLIECALSSDSRDVPFESLPDGLDMVDDPMDVQTLDVGFDIDGSESFTLGKNAVDTAMGHTAPEEILLSPEIGLTADALHAFIMQFVLRGRSQESRKISCQVAIKLCQQLSQDCRGPLFMSLVSYPLTEICVLGSASVQFLELLQSLLGFAGESIDTLDIVEVAKKLTQCFCDQMQILRANGKERRVSNLDALGQSRDAVRKRFDLSKCAYCSSVKLNTTKRNSYSHQIRTAQGARTSQPKSRVSSSRRIAATAALDDTPWLPEQVRPFIKCRLDASTDSSVSNEFNLFIQLKCRLAISDVHLTINDPKGRFVKTVAIFFTPRQVNDAAELKSEEYSGTWQLCGNLSLSRGATRISYALPASVVAANLRFEYKQFFERPGGSRTADGSPILHCPRCTRVVTNAHGVCGHCGEVAFQCRKCRHINYDRFDSFLCVECGYCSAGTFSYEITAGVASNAVAIVDDESYDRSVKILKVATNLYGELKIALESKIRLTKKRPRTPIPDFLNGLSPALKCAFIGQLPTDSDSVVGNTGALSSLVSRANGEALRQSSAANRARSLLRLARSLRNNNTDMSNHRRELLVREAFFGGLNAEREFSIDELDDLDGDMAGFVNIDRFGSESDPLSRLVASIQSRRENVETTSVANFQASNTNQNEIPHVPDVGTSNIGKSLLEECEKLYRLLRESERECYEISRRIKAWQRLEHDALAEIAHPVQVRAMFIPSNCNKCSGPITLNLLILVMRLFSDLTKVPLTKEFVRALFLEPPHLSKDLFDLKRLAIITLASKSEAGAKLVLAELQGRLKTSSDGAAAEILGKLLAENDFPFGHPFVLLATQTLEERSDAY